VSDIYRGSIALKSTASGTKRIITIIKRYWNNQLITLIDGKGSRWKWNDCVGILKIKHVGKWGCKNCIMRMNTLDLLFIWGYWLLIWFK
jgi:hypothetical protein